ncbi:WXG100-like domain-containing protein [Saccharopolyspora phatthalungensis]|uniref:DNA-binding Lrp family transcriptional regulator n=1 Tax=Saccharopolyspora phatthalungensis TaxID=664693 RepID=A0A840QHB8_9PSEU|nr:hypothetical protein [Saccharopolyspora phatthalungensis]MBB5159380.1 DNA-binding Lrp family transcriptional regulator [Saccharopolyspora phatthalungensis]
MSVLVPEEVRRLFQVLTGEDMTDADEDALFAVAERLESGAATVEVLAPAVGEVMGQVRGEFSGKAADRFAERLAGFGPVLEAGGVGLRELAGFVRNLALQVQYLKFVTVGGLLLLWAEVAWAVSMAGVTAGASMAWLAARFAVMRFLLSRWWGQLFMRLAVAQVVGIGLQVVMDVGAQGVQFALGTRKKWDGQLTGMAVGVGAFSALLAVPLSALGNVVGNAVTKVLVRGLGDEIDVEVLAAAAKHAVEEHAELYPASSMARFADVVSKNIEDYAGMSVRAMWAARFGHGLGESLEEGLTEMLGEAGYGALSGQGAQWNPFSFTAGLSEAVGSGIGNLAGLALRGQLIPAGRAQDAAGGEKESGSADTDTDVETSEDAKVDPGSQPREFGSPKELSTRDLAESVPGSTTVATDLKSALGPVVKGIPVTSGFLPVDLGVDAAATMGLDPKAGARETPNYTAPTSWHADDENAPGAPWDLDRPVTPPPSYSRVTGDNHAGAWSSAVAATGVSAERSAGSEIVAKIGDSSADLPPNDGHPGVDTPRANGHKNVDDARLVEPLARLDDVSWESSSFPDVAEVSDLPSDVAMSRNSQAAAALPGADAWSTLPGQESAWDGMTVLGVPAGRDSAAENSDAVGVGDSTPHSSVLPGSSGVVSPVGPVGLPAGAVRVTVPVDVVADGGVAEFVRGRVRDVGVGPVVLVSGVGSSPGVVVSSGQASEVARVLGRDVVAMMPGRGERGPRWMRFSSNGSRPRPVADAIGSDSGLAAKVDEVGRKKAVRFSRELAARLGTQGSGLRIHAGAGSPSQTEVPAFGSGSGQIGEVTAEPADDPAWAVLAPVRDFLISSDFVGTAARDSIADSAAPSPAESGFAAANPGPEALDVAERPDSATRLQELGRVEARRARDAGEPHSGATLGEKFGRSKSWGQQRLAEIRTEGGATRRAFRVREREDARLEARRARDAGEPYTGAALGERFGKSTAWGLHRLREIADEASGAAGGASGSEGSLSTEGAPSADAAVARWTESDLRREVEWARSVGGPRDAAVRIVQGTHDVVTLARDGADVSLDDVVALVAVKVAEVGRDGAVRFSRELAARLDAQGTGLGVRAGAGPDPQADASVSEGSAPAESAGVPMTWGFDPDVDAVFDSMDFGGWSSGVRGTGSAGAGGGRKRRRGDGSGSVDEGAARRPVGPQPNFPVSPEIGDTGASLAGSHENARVEAHRARYTGTHRRGAALGKKFGKSATWGMARLREIGGEGGGRSRALREGEQKRADVREAARVEARRARDAGEPYTGAVLGEKFGMSESWGSERLVEIRTEGGATRSALLEQEGERVREAARVEARRARDAGEPYTGAALGEKFGMSKEWGKARNAEINVGDGTARVLREREQERANVREAARVEARRARDAGEPYTGAELGAKFGKSKAWGLERLVEIRDEGGATRSAVRQQELERVREAARVEARRARDEGEPDTALTEPVVRERDQERANVWEEAREAARAEARRARDAGEPYTGAELGAKFEKGETWGLERLAEIRAEGGATRSTVRRQEVDRAWEAVRVEARRARDAGEPYTGAALGKKFGKSVAWGKARLAEIKAEGGATQSAVRQQEMDRVREAARAEARRARDAGEPYTGAALGKKFGKSKPWGTARLAELNAEDGNAWALGEGGQEREAARVEARRARDVGEPYSAARLGERFGMSAAWGQARLAEIKDEGGVTRSALQEQEGKRVREEARAEARRARDVGEPYTAKVLGEKFGMSTGWGQQRLAEIRGEGGVTRSAVRGREGKRVREEARAEARRAREAGEPHSGATLGAKFGRSADWGSRRLAEIRAEGGGGRPDSRAEAPVLQESADSGQVGGAVTESEDDLWSLDFDAALESWWGSPAGAGWPWGDDVPQAASEDADLLAVAGSNGRNLGRDEGSGDEGAERGPVGPADDVVDPGLEAENAAEMADLAELGSAELLNEAARAEARARDGVPTEAVPSAELLDAEWMESGPEVSFPIVPELVDIGVVDGGSPGVESWSWDVHGAAPDVGALGSGSGHLNPDESGLPDLGAEAPGRDGVPNSAELREAARVEARRARDAGEPYTAVVLGQKFGMTRSWGKSRLAEIRGEGGVTRSVLQERVREAARAEARRARDAGEPYTGAALGRKFGKSAMWGSSQLAEIGGTGGAMPRVFLEQKVERVREAARAEARRARDAGEPYSGVALGKKFGKGESWGKSRLAELKDEGVGRRRPLREDERELAKVREAARVEARRARDAGEPYTGAALGKKFGKSAAWGVERLREIKNEVGGSVGADSGYLNPDDLGLLDLAADAGRDAGAMDSIAAGAASLPADLDDPDAQPPREVAGAAKLPGSTGLREQARAEARRARDAGEPYSGSALARKFGKSNWWGRARLAEIKDEGGVTRPVLQEQEEERVREAGRAEARRARDAGEPYTRVELGRKFGKSNWWGRARLREIRDEGGGSADAASGSGGGVPVQRVSSVGVDADAVEWSQAESVSVAGQAAPDLLGFWDVGDVPGVGDLDLGAGSGYLNPEVLDLAADVTGRGSGVMDSIGADAASLPADVGDAEPTREVVDAAELPGSAGLREAARAEARRAWGGGKPYSGVALGQKFGKSAAWGKARLAELKGEGVGKRRPLREEERELAKVREVARVEARRARDAGEPYTAAALGQKFGKSESWGNRLLAEIRTDGDASWPVVRDREGERLREVARVEARRARDAGEPYTAAALGQKFGKSGSWGHRLLAEIRTEAGATQSISRGRKRGRHRNAEVNKVGRSAGAASGSATEVLVEGFSTVDGVAVEWSQLEVESVGVAGWTESALLREIEWARLMDAPRDVAVGIVQGTHDVVALARDGADVSFDDVVALVAVKIDEVGPDEAVRFSRELAARLDTPRDGAGR